MLVAPAAFAAFRDDDGLFTGEIRHDAAGSGVPDQCADRDFDDQIICRLAVFSAAGAVGALFCLKLTLIAEIGKGGEIGIRDEDHVAALSPVAAVGTARGNIFFAVKRNGAVAAVTGFYRYFRFIYKHDETSQMPSP